MDKVTSLERVCGLLESGRSYMIAGFAEVGTPYTLIDCLLAHGTRDMTLISNDTGDAAKPGVSQLVFERRIRKAIVSHVGKNPETGRQVMAHELELELVPQGTLAERIRCGGAGIGGIYVKTGVGTQVADGKELRRLNGEDYLLELPLRADIALLHAEKADRLGNLVFHMTARNYNPIMGTAPDLLIVEANQIVEPGMLDPEEVMLPGPFVDWIAQAERR